MFALVLSRPWLVRCPRCKAVNQAGELPPGVLPSASDPSDGPPSTRDG